MPITEDEMNRLADMVAQRVLAALGQPMPGASTSAAGPANYLTPPPGQYGPPGQYAAPGNYLVTAPGQYVPELPGNYASPPPGQYATPGNYIATAPGEYPDAAPGQYPGTADPAYRGPRPGLQGPTAGPARSNAGA